MPCSPALVTSAGVHFCTHTYSPVAAEGSSPDQDLLLPARDAIWLQRLDEFTRDTGGSGRTRKWTGSLTRQQHHARVLVLQRERIVPGEGVVDGLKLRRITSGSFEFTRRSNFSRALTPLDVLTVSLSMLRIFDCMTMMRSSLTPAVFSAISPVGDRSNFAFDASIVPRM